MAALWHSAIFDGISRMLDFRIGNAGNHWELRRTCRQPANNVEAPAPSSLQNSLERLTTAAIKRRHGVPTVPLRVIEVLHPHL